MIDKDKNGWTAFACGYGQPNVVKLINQNETFGKIFQHFFSLLRYNPKSFDITSVVLLLEKYFSDPNKYSCVSPNWSKLTGAVRIQGCTEFSRSRHLLLPLLFVSEWWRSVQSFDHQKWKETFARTVTSLNGTLILRLFLSPSCKDLLMDES